jgi:hypothetical protein
MIYHFNKAIFYCNGGAGVGEVIKGWDVGVNGMYCWLLCFCCVQEWIVCQYSPRICHGVSGESWSHLYGETI